MCARSLSESELYIVYPAVCWYVPSHLQRRSSSWVKELISVHQSWLFLSQGIYVPSAEPELGPTGCDIWFSFPPASFRRASYLFSSQKSVHTDQCRLFSVIWPGECSLDTDFYLSFYLS